MRCRDADASSTLATWARPTSSSSFASWRNVDTGGWARALPWSESVELDGHTIYVLHILEDLPVPDGISAVVYGHSHKPSIEDRGGVLYLNPGSAGPRRFRLPVSVARLSVVDGRVTARIIELTVA